MLRALLIALGLLELLAPKPLVEFWMRRAVESPEEVEVRPWVVTAARVEGVLVLLYALRMGRRQRAQRGAEPRPPVAE